MKILTILGARPQFIKAAVVSREIQKHVELNEIIVHTGQHFDKNMSDIFFEEMNIPTPKYNLNVNGGTHGQMTGTMMIELEKVIMSEDPDWVLVYGDTNSTLAGALVARKLNIKVAHVEAGLRNFDLTVPEDVNRILTDRISDALFVPTELAQQNLKKEGFESFPCDIIETGDLMYDAVKFYDQLSNNNEPIIDKLQLYSGKYILCTIHRAHNTTLPGIKETFTALNEISEKQQIIFPIHPRTKNALKVNGISLNQNINLIDPVGYIDMIQLVKNSSLVITDSGGLQKEAYALKKKSLLLMDYTPWEELVTNNFSVVTDIEKSKILEAFNKVQQFNPDFDKKLYGSGNTGIQIVEYFLQKAKN